MPSELAQILHSQHVRTLALLDALEERTSGRPGRRPLDPGDAGDRRLLRDVISVVENDIKQHFAVEEALLFPIVAEAGASDLAIALAQEHVAMGPVAKRLKEMAGALLQGDPTSVSWNEFQSVAEDFISRSTLHIQKEEMTLIQRLSSFLDEDMDRRLAERCTGGVGSDSPETRKC